ncbi:MAG: OprO/OprP family phosphate-selective porin [Planctomycetes bacterium]|nr:OprO/OprP family phosphate-selective porin [Planctomycetota bacterium]
MQAKADPNWNSVSPDTPGPMTGVFSQNGIQSPDAFPVQVPTNGPPIAEPPPVVQAQAAPSNLPTVTTTADLERRIRDLESRLESLPSNTSATPVPELIAPKEEKPIAPPKAPDLGQSLKMEGTWKNALWFENKDKTFRWAVGGVIQYDMSYFNADKNVVNSIGTFNNLVDPGTSLQDGTAFRRARLRFSGTMYEQVEFFAQYEFAQALDLRRRTLGISPVPATSPNNDFDPGDNVGFNELYFGLVKIPVLGNVRFGRHRESLNFVTATQDNFQVWLERGHLFDAFNGDFNFSNGITVQRNYFDNRAYSLFGFFQINNNSNRGFYSVGDGEFAYDGRLTCLPIYNEQEKLWVHLGVDYSYRNLHQDQVRYRVRPMIRSGPGFLTPNILNSGTIFSPDAQQIANLEFAMAWKRFTFAAEATTSWVTNAYTGALPLANGRLPAGAAARGTYNASGAYVEALCFLTPDHRRYRKERPGYDRVIPEETFYFKDTDQGICFSKGAWEVGVRYDYADLTDSGINGGMGNAVTFCCNWYLNPNARVQANYSWMNRQFAPTDTAGRVDGSLQAFGLRFNVDF